MKLEHNYTSSTIDPDGHQVYYLFDWGDGATSGWIGPFNSGENATAKHKWRWCGTYEIRVKAKDSKNAESEWSEPLSVSMPRGKVTRNSFFQQFLQRYPNLFPILRYFIGL